MASSVAVLHSVVVHNVHNDPPTKPPAAHTRTSDPSREMQGSNRPLRKMQSESGLRQRVTLDNSAIVPTQQDASATSSGGPLTPTSSEEYQQTPVQHAVSPSQETWRRFVEWAKSRNSPRKISKEEEEYNEKHGFNKIISEKVNDQPKGFPRLAAFQHSDDDLIMFRAFNQSHIRLLIEDEVEITRIEEDLKKLDLADDADKAMKDRIKCTLYENTMGDERAKLKRKLRVKLIEYDDLLLKFSRVRSLEKTSKRDQRALFNWVFTKKPLHKSYYNFIYHDQDFVSVPKCSEQGRSRYWHDWVLTHVAKHPESPLKSFLRPDTEVEKSSDPKVRYLSNSRLELIVGTVVVLVSVSSILLPVFILLTVSMSSSLKGLTVFACVCTFCTTIMVTTEARTYEVLVGTAAYAAFLVAIFGNGNSCVQG